MTGSDCPKGLREEHDNIQNFMAGPTTSLGQCFGENLGFFCKLSPLIHVTNGASRSYHLDDTTFNYRGIKSERRVCWVTSGLIFCVFVCAQ